MKIRDALLLSLMAGVLHAPATYARTFRVPTDAPTIQEALDAASARDTVIVGYGTFTGPGTWNLTFRGRDLYLTSAGGPEFTILDGTEGQPEGARGLYFSSESWVAVVEGFTIQNFNAHYEGSGILVAGTAQPTVLGCVFRGNTVANTTPQGPQGAAIQVRDTAKPLFESCYVGENGGWDHDGSIVNVDDTAVLRMTDCFIAHNLGHDACIVRVGRHARAELLRCAVLGNIPCGIHAESTLQMEACLLVGNGSPHGGGARMKSGTARRCTFAQNWGYGGGLEVLADGDVTAERSIFHGNCGDLGSQILLRGALRLSCCAVADSGIWLGPGGSVEWTGPQVSEDPQFCRPGDCAEYQDDDDYSLRTDSPCRPQFSPCHQLIGAREGGCLAPEPVGACCVADTCRLLPASGCAETGGDYQGDGESCFPDPCTETPVERTTWGRIKAAYRGSDR